MPAPRLCLVGAAPSTKNLGVGALLYSAAGGVLARCPYAELSVFDFGTGAGPLTLPLADGPRVVRRVAASGSRRVWTPEAFVRMRAEARLGLATTPAARALRGSDALLDVSGGDSFTDLYGKRRFWTTTHPKLLARALGTPVVLLPQTYGPFADARLKRIARRVVLSAAAAWARDERSHEALAELCGADFDPARQQLGVDLAFGLAPRDPGRPLSGTLEEWLAGGEPVVGVNVSGLIHSDPRRAREHYGFRADYRALVRGLIEGLVGRGARVLLVPHVLAPPGAPESDPEACARVIQALGADSRKRVTVLEPPYDAPEVKHVIARLDWFCGTRMHSAIAALSSGVPTAAIAYSLKFAGVFEGVGLGPGVVDPRALDTAVALEALLEAYALRAEHRAALAAALPATRARAAAQLDAIVAAALPGTGRAAG